MIILVVAIIIIMIILIVNDNTTRIRELKKHWNRGSRDCGRRGLPSLGVGAADRGRCEAGGGQPEDRKSDTPEDPEGLRLSGDSARSGRSEQFTAPSGNPRQPLEWWSASASRPRLRLQPPPAASRCNSRGRTNTIPLDRHSSQGFAYTHGQTFGLAKSRQSVYQI